ncbi:MAG: hypothetical protein KC492_11110, partial [Myxococcales bacterium]|nr:hypothetical protein [Myxococcales bacterium]
MSQLGEVLYVGPLKTSEGLRTLAEVNRQAADSLPPPSRRAMRRVDSLEWPRLTEPRKLVVSLVEAHGLKLKNPEAIPHDVWDSGRLPAISLSDRLTLLLVGFDLTFQPVDSTGELELAPAPRPPRIQKSYRASGPVDLSEFSRRFPGCKTTPRGQVFTLAGTVEAHEALAALIGGSPPAAQRRQNRQPPTGGRRRPSEQRITLTVKQQPALAVLRRIAEGLQLSLQFGAEEAMLTARLRSPVELSVREATLEQVLGDLGRQAGVELTVVGQTIRV